MTSKPWSNPWDIVNGPIISIDKNNTYILSSKSQSLLMELACKITDLKILKNYIFYLIKLLFVKIPDLSAGKNWPPFIILKAPTE